MASFRRTMIVEFVLPSSAAEGALPLTWERIFGVFLRCGGRTIPSQYFRSPLNDEQWRTFVRQMRECNVNRSEDGYRGAQAIQEHGLSLYKSLAALSEELREFLDAAGTARRLVIQTTRPELHLLPWGALNDLNGDLLAAGDLSVVQAWQNFSETSLTTPGTLNLVSVLGADTGKDTGLSLKSLPPEITQDAKGAPDILHMEEHGNAVLTEIGGVRATTVAEQYAAARLALLWSCYSSAANSWGESPALSLHRAGAALVLSFQAELHVQDAASISKAFYGDVFGPEASRDPESALVKIRAQKFATEFEFANWASMTVYLRGPLDLSAMVLNGQRVPARAWLAEGGDDPGWAKLAAAVCRLTPGSRTGMATPYESKPGAFVALPKAVVESWRGNVIRLDGGADPLSDDTMLGMNLQPRDAPKTDAADKLAWFFARIAHFGAPLIVWTDAREWHLEFVKTVAVNSPVTFLLLYERGPTAGLAELVEWNEVGLAREASGEIPDDCADDEMLSAAYFAFARGNDEASAKKFLARVRGPVERLLLSGNFVSRFKKVPGLAEGEPDRPVGGLDRRHVEEDFYRAAVNATAPEASLRDSGRAKKELGYLMGSQGRWGTAEIFYRGALEDLERSTDRGPRRNAALAGTLRDWADVMSTDQQRLDEASKLLARALAMHRFQGRRLAVAYALVTAAKIALSGCRFRRAMEAAMDAANRFEECDNWWGWSSAVEILLDALAETGETAQMKSVIGLALDKIERSRQEQSSKDEVRRALMLGLARAHWLGGELDQARAVLVETLDGGDGVESEAGERLRRFLDVPPVGFMKDVREAGTRGQLGRLGLLGLEAQEQRWKAEGLRLVGAELARAGGGGAARVAAQLGLGIMPEPESERAAQAVLFTGHMIDAPDRASVRFPASAEEAAREAIRRSLEAMLEASPGCVVGIAGGASGGDLLFHEVCAELGIETLLRLTLPREEFAALSVAPAAGDWMTRFDALLERLGPQRVEMLGETQDLPAWMGERGGYDVWQRTNLWLVEEAIAHAPRQTLLALWDGKSGDGPGGTQHLVEAGPRYGIEVAPPIRLETLV